MVGMGFSFIPDLQKAASWGEAYCYGLAEFYRSELLVSQGQAREDKTISWQNMQG